MKYLIILLLLAIHPLAFAQNVNFNKSDDKIASFYKIGFIGVRDNLAGQLSKTLEATLTKWLSQNRQLTFELENNSEFYKLNTQQRATLANRKKWHGLLAAEITRAGALYNIKIQLFDQNGLLFFEKENSGIKEINQSKINQIGPDLLAQLFSELPYQGWVLSRTNNLVTINYGKNHGAFVGEELPTFFTSQVLRHPQFNFATKFEKFILGQLVIQKVDTDISFASVMEERYPGAIEVGSKINRSQMIHYPALVKTETGQLINPGLNPHESHLIIGRSPHEWRPQKPQFGLLNLNSGFSSVSFADSTLSGSSALVPHLSLSSEVWLTTQLNLNLGLTQSSGSLSLNTGSRPLAMTESRLGGYYKFNLSDREDSLSFVGLGVQMFSSQFSLTDTTPLSGLNLNLLLRLALPNSKLAFRGHLENSILSTSARQDFGISLEFFNQPMRSWLLGLDNTQYNWTKSSNTAALGLNRLWLGVQYYF